MSTTSGGMGLDDLIEYYQDKPVQFYEDLGFTLADTQKEILRAVQDHNRVLVWSGNGTGKTAGVMMAEYWYVMTTYNAIGLTTSGNYAVMKDTSWPFLQTIHQRAKQQYPIRAEAKQSAPRIEFPADQFPEWWIKFRSPKSPKNLEGRHGRRAFVVIDEADKPDVTQGHFESATSTASSTEDRCVAIANPPQDPGDVAYQKWQDDRWHTIEFSSFDSHNVQRQLGMLPDDDQRGHIPGLVELDLIREDFETYHDRPFPGVNEARKAVTRNQQGLREADGDYPRRLSPEWYRRRLGVMPPKGSAVLRPFYERHIDDAVDRWRTVTDDGRRPADARQGDVQQRGVDVARGGGDRTVAVDRWGSGLLDVVLAEEAGDHVRNEDLLADLDDRRTRRGPLLVDAVGEGSGVADHLRRRRPNVRRFDAREDPWRDDDEYYNCYTEALVMLGNRLRDGALVAPGSDLEDELREAARVLELEQRSSGKSTVQKVVGKDTLKESAHLGRSPDVLDAAALAAYDAVGDATTVDVGGVVG